MLRNLCMIAVFFAYVSGFNDQDANDWIDSILDGPFQTEAQYRRLDPYKLPDLNIDLISKRIQDNKAVLNKGKLVNLSKVRRSGDCSMPHWTFANLYFSCFLTFDHLVVNYTANASYDNVQVVFYPTTSIRRSNLTAQIMATPVENKTILRLIVINSIGPMVVTTKMINIGDVAEMIGPDIREGIVQNTTINLHKILNGKFKDGLAYAISENPIPFFN